MTKPAQILEVLKTSTRANPISVTVYTTPEFSVQASNNPFKNGFALHVAFEGRSYGVTGFSRRPSGAAYELALRKCREYGEALVDIKRGKILPAI